MESALQFMNNSREFAMEYYKDDDLFLAMDQESVEKYAIDTSMERMELQNHPILDGFDDKRTLEGPKIWGSMTHSVAYMNLPPSPPSEESFEFPFVACNAQIAQEQDLLNFQVQDMELSFISKPKRYESVTVTPVVVEYIDTVDSDLTDSTEFTLLDKNYSDLSNDVSLEDSASRILSQLNNQTITNEFNSNMKSMKKNLEDEQRRKTIEKEKLLEAIKLKRIQKEKLLEERRLKKIQKLEEERKLKKIQNETLGKKTQNRKGNWIVKLEKIPIEKGKVIWVKKIWK